MIKNIIKFKSRLLLDNFVFSKQRKSTTKNIISIIVSITIALLIAIIVSTIVGYNPGDIIRQLFMNGFVDPQSLIVNIVVFGIGGLAFSFAFKAGVFNLGISGQMLGAGVTMLGISTLLANVHFPNGTGQLFMIIIALTSGALIATFVSLLKIYLNVNEVISSILLNWIIFFLVRLIIKNYLSDSSIILTQSYEFPEQFRLVASGIGGWLPALIVFILLVIIITFVNKFTVFGHKIISVGFSANASRFVGYNVKLINIVTLAISGAIAGIMGYVLYTSGNSPSIPISSSTNEVPIQGFNSIAIGLIAMNNPIAIVPIAFLIGMFDSATPFLDTPVSFNELIIGLIILASAMFVILLNYKPWIYIKQKIYGLYAKDYYANYENKMETLISKYSLMLSESRKNKSKIDIVNPTDEQTKIIKQYQSYVYNDRNRFNSSVRRVWNTIIYQTINNVLNNPKSNEDYVINLEKQYLREKELILGQYKKQILISKATQLFFPDVGAKNIINIKNHRFDMQFLRLKTKKQFQIFRLENKIANSNDENSISKLNEKINKLKASIDKNFNQLEQWKLKTEKRTFDLYNLRTKLYPNLDKVKDSFIKQAQKISISDKDRQLLINWINDSYNLKMNDKDNKYPDLAEREL